MSHMRELFHQMDVDSSGELTLEEMEYFLTEPTLCVYLDALGVTADNARMLFRLMDTKELGRINLEEFSEGCLRLQGEAKSTDVHILIHQIKLFLSKWGDFTEFVEGRFSALSDELGIE